MKFQCEKQSLSEAIAGVSKAVTQRSNVAALEGILFTAIGTSLTLTGYDLEMGITTRIDAKIKDEGSVVLNAKLIGDMVRRLPSDIVEIECGETLYTSIKGGITEYSINGIPAKEYPELPAAAMPSQSGEENKNGMLPAIAIDGPLLKEMIETTIYAVAQDDKKPANTGEKFVLEKDKLTLVALDGFRLAICERPVKAGREVNIVIPAKTLNEVSKLIGDSEEAVVISASKRYVVFSLKGYIIISRLLEEAFLDYKKTINPDYCTRVEVEVKSFCDTIERASLIITERLKNPLRITFEDQLTVRCQTELGKVLDSIDCKFEGEKMEVGFNYRYLLDALRNSGCDKVAIELTGSLSPVKVVPVEGNDFIFLVMPVRFKND
ncbi:MAG: DNA polymerase III subunit beta [Pygmaiobacter sp.]